MGKRKGGRPSTADRERYPSGQRKPALDRDIPSPFATAKRAVLADPKAAAAALSKAVEEHEKEHKRDRLTEREVIEQKTAGLRRRRLEIDGEATATVKRPLSIEDAARAISRILSPRNDRRDEKAIKDDRAGTALGRYYLWSQYRGGTEYRLSEEHYAAGKRYAELHGAAWAAHRGELSDFTAAFGGDLAASGLVLPNRHPKAHLGNQVASDGVADLNPAPDLSSAEMTDKRRAQWGRYLKARDALLCSGPVQIIFAIEELVIEDRDPWWIEPSPDRLGEEAARARAGRSFEDRARISRGLEALAVHLGIKKETKPRETAAAPMRRRREGLEVMFRPDDVEIDKAVLEAAVSRLRKRAENIDG